MDEYYYSGYCKHGRPGQCADCCIAAGIAPNGKGLADPVYLEVIRMVRADPQIGKGTCSVTDECRTDGEIYQLLEEEFEGATHRRSAQFLFREFKRVEVTVDKIDQERFAIGEAMRKGEW